MKIDKKRLVTCPIYFIEKIIRMNLTWFQKEWLELAQSKHRICFMAFRSSGKTRQLFVNYFTWCAITRPNTQYLIISKTLPQAIEVLKDIRITLQTNPILKQVMPSNRTQTWSRTELELKNCSRILSKAYNENVRGLHVDGLGCDEMGEYEDHEIFKKAVLPTIRAKRGFFIGVGTPKSELDLLHSVESDPGFASIFFDRYPAEGDKGNLFETRYPDTKVIHLDGSVEIRDKKDNQLLETYNNWTWSQEFLLKPVSLEDKLFPDHMIEACMDHSAKFQDQVVNMKQYFMGVDFAMSAQSGSDYTVIIVVEKGMNNNKLKIVAMERFKGLDYVMQKQRIKEIADKYSVTKILGDESSFGKTFIYDLKAEGLPIDGYKFTPASKAELVKTLRDQFEKEGFIIPFDPNCAITRTRMNVLIDELSKFGIVFDMKSKCVKFEGAGKHDDCVIALGLVNFIARHISMSLFSVIKGSQNKGFNPFIVK